MANLTVPRIVRLSNGEADAEVTCDTSGDRLFWAVRAAAWLEADKAALKAGTGAIDFGEVVSVAGVNTVNATGLPLDAELNFGFVVEPAAIVGADNAILYSEDFTNAVWTKDRSLIDVGQSDYLLGTAASRLRDDGVSAAGIIGVKQQILGLAAGTYTFSIYAKADQSDSIGLKLANTGGESTGDGTTLFRISDQIIYGGSATGHVNKKIISASNGWSRASITFTTVASKNVIFSVLVGDAGKTFLTPDGTNSIFIFGSQVSSGTQLLPYSTTTGTPV